MSEAEETNLKVDVESEEQTISLLAALRQMG